MCEEVIRNGVAMEMCMGCVGQGCFGVLQHGQTTKMEIRLCPRCHGTKFVKKGTPNPLQFTEEENKRSKL